MLRINDEAPNFTAETSQGTINFHEWIGNGWAILFSHPKDFTPVCTTELGYMAGLQPEFEKRNCKIIGLSVDPVTSHSKWAVDIEETQGHKVNYPMIGDPELKVAKLYDMLPADAGDTSEGRTAATNATVRTVFVIGPDKKIKLTLSYPMSTGRNFDEVLRVRRFNATHGQSQSSHTGELETGRRCNHPRRRFQTMRPNRYIPAAGKHPGLICGSFQIRRRIPQRRLAQLDLQAVLSAVPGACFLLYWRPGGWHGKPSFDPQRDTDQYIALAVGHALKIKHVLLTRLHADFVA